MKNLFFALAFMLMGTFAFANTNEMNLENPVVNDKEITAMQPVSEIADVQTMIQEDLCIDIYEFSDGTVIIVVYDC